MKVDTVLDVGFSKILTARKDLKLKEKRIQEELDEDGKFPFDLTDGRTVRANNESQCSQSDTT